MGSGDWTEVVYIYWSADSVGEVQAHYERYFGAFAANERGDGVYRYQNYPAFSPLLYLYSDYSNFGISIAIVNADQDERRMICCYFEGNPQEILDNLPREGSIVMVTYSQLVL